MSNRKIRAAVFSALLLNATLITAGCKKSSSDDDGGPAGPTPGHLTFVIQPSATPPGNVIAPPFTVEIRDASNALVATATNDVTLSFQSNPGGATLGGTVTRAAVAGTATFDDITVSFAGNGYTLAASTPGFFSGISSAFNVQPPNATQLVITSQPPATRAPFQAFGVVVEARNAGGVIDTGFNGPVTIAFGAQPSGNLLMHASGIDGGDPVLEIVNAGTPAVLGTVTPTFPLGEVFGMVYDPTLRLIRATNFWDEFCLLNPGSGDVVRFGDSFTLTDSHKGVAFNGMGQIRSLSPYDDQVRTIDLISGVDSDLGTTLTFSGFTVMGCTGLARHPTSGVFYAVLNEGTFAFTGRPLVTVNMGTGVCTLVGDTEDFVASLSFAPDGTLYATTGDGAFTPETLWTVNITTGALTQVLTLGNGDDGESAVVFPRRLGGTLTVNAVNGVATFTGLSIDQLGNGYTLTLSSGGLTSATTTAINVSGAVTPTATVEFDSASSSASEDVGTATVTLSLSTAQGHDMPVMIYIDFASTALALEDHNQPLGFQVIIPAGQTTLDITIPIVDDAVVESDEDVILSLMPPILSAGLGGNSSHTLTITNDD